MNNQMVIETLIEAKQLIADEAAWTQGHYARDINGDPCSAVGTSAECWCTLGAVSLAVINKGNSYKVELKTIQVLSDYAANRDYENVADFNDKVDHSNIMAMFDDVICELEQRG